MHPTRIAVCVACLILADIQVKTEKYCQKKVECQVVHHRVLLLALVQEGMKMCDLSRLALL